MPTQSKNLVLSSLCDITFPVRAKGPLCGRASRASCSAQEAEEPGIEDVGLDEVY